MKKLLLNYKSINCAFLLMLVGANTISGQTVFEETFGTSLNAAYTGGTSIPAVNYTVATTSSNAISTVSVSPSTDMYLNFSAKAITALNSTLTTGSTAVTLSAANALILVGQIVSGAGIPSNTTVTAVNGTSLTLSAAATATSTTTTLSFYNLSNRCSLTAPFSNITPGLNTTLTSNTSLVTWSVNMKASRTMSSSSNTYADGSYYLAVVLCATGSDLTAANTNGYALILQRSIDNAAGVNPGAVRLVKFQNGIGSQALGSIVSSALLTTPALNAGAAPSAAAPNNLSLKVAYNPDFDSWQLFYREDASATTFVDPSTGTFLSAGSAVVDATYTTTPVTHFGYLAGLSTSTSVANQLQIDNFKINLSAIPAFTPVPVVEKRQSFSSTSNPTVANLVATGTNVKWFAAATGGTQLAANTPLTYTNFYASQTINGTESERAACQVFVGDIALRTLPFHENFSNYTIGDKLILINNNGLTGTGLGFWSVSDQITTFTAASDDALIATQPTTWTSSVLPTPGGNAVTFDKSGIDPQILFNAPTTGSVYASCLFMVTNLNAITNLSVSTPLGTNPETYLGPGHFFSLANYLGTLQTNAYTAAVYLKTSSADATKFNIGINASPADIIVANDIIWDSTDYSVNTPITIVTNYSYDNLTSKLWINPTSNSTEPTPNAVTLPRTVALAVDRVRLTQQSSATTPFITLDEIRVANNWGQALGGTATLGIVNNSISNLSIYPNPVTNGKLFISSSSNLEKEVVIYTALGQKVLQDKTVSEAINVSTLTPGTYFVKITEADLTTTKKLIIK